MTCDFQSITDPLDEALVTRFICFVDNDAVLKSLFKLKEEAAKLGKGTFYGQTSKLVYKVGQPKSKANPPKASTPKAKDTPQGKLDQPFSKGSCGRCGKKSHTGKDCPHIMISAITARGRDTCNQIACPKESETIESGTCDSWI